MPSCAPGSGPWSCREGSRASRRSSALRRTPPQRSSPVTATCTACHPRWPASDTQRWPASDSRGGALDPPLRLSQARPSQARPSQARPSQARPSPAALARFYIFDFSQRAAVLQRRGRPAPETHLKRRRALSCRPVTPLYTHLSLPPPLLSCRPVTPQLFPRRQATHSALL
jgi:hypothetical protein